jgi:protoporphyrinogen IX oxidase
MNYLTVKALHIVFVVSWFAALFYIVRLFIYDAEAKSKPAHEKRVLQDQLRLMQWRLWYIIGWPAMVLTLVFGVWMIILNDALLEMKWMQIKLGMVFGLLAYHLSCERMLRKIKADQFNRTSGFLRMWNEVATLFLVAIVFLAVMKDSLNWIWGVVGLIGTGLTLMILIKVYKKFRKT